MFKAIKDRKLEQVEWHLDKTSNRNDAGQIPLVYACSLYVPEYTNDQHESTSCMEENSYTQTRANKFCQTEIVKLLITKTKDLSACDNHGWMAIHHAVFNKNTAVTELLLKSGIVFNLCSSINDSAKCIEKGSSPLHIAVRGGSGDIVTLLNKYGANCNLQDSQGSTPLILAVEEGNDAMVQLLLEFNDIDVNIAKSDTLSPLNMSIDTCNFVTSRLIIEHGACVNGPISQENPASILHKIIPLIPRVGENKLELVKSLLKHEFDINAQDCNGDTPLHFLIPYLVKWNRVADQHFEIANLLISHKDIDLNIQNNKKETIIQSATVQFLSEPSKYIFVKKIINLLCERRVDLNIKDVNEQTVLDLVVKNQKLPMTEDIVELFLKHGCNLNNVDQLNRTVLHNIIGKLKPVLKSARNATRYHGYGYRVRYMNGFRLIQLLLKYGASCDIIDYKGITVLHRAILCNLIEVIGMLLDSKCSHDTVNTKLPALSTLRELSDPLQESFIQTKLEIYSEMSALQIVMIQSIYTTYHGVTFNRLLEAGCDIHVKCNDNFNNMGLMGILYNSLHYLAFPNAHARSWFARIATFMSAGVPFSRNHTVCVACSNDSVHSTHSDILYKFEHFILTHSLDLTEEVINLGYKFNLEHHTSMCDRGRLEYQNVNFKTNLLMLEEMESIVLSLQILAVRVIRCNLYPNAWIAAKLLDIPKLLYEIYFEKYMMDYKSEKYTS